MRDVFTTGEDFQELLLACILRHPDQFAAYVPVIKPGFFTGVQSTLVARCMVDYYRERSRFPSFTVLRELAVSAAKGITDNAQHAALVKDFVDKIEKHETGDYLFVRDHTLKFVKEQSVVSTMREAIALLKEGKIPPDGFSSMFAKAIDVGSNLEDLGYLLHQDSDKVVDYVSNETYGISTGYPLLDKVWRNGWGPGWLVVPLAPPKRFKCVKPDTPVIMADGTTRKACEVKVGDLLMGDDSTPRRVTNAGYGRGPMYRVTQRNGDAYEVNDAHILCLRSEDGTRELEITAEDLYKMQQEAPSMANRYWQGFKVGMELPSRELPLEPYFLGLWLGDGSASTPVVAVGDADPEIATYLTDYAARLGMKLRVDRGSNVGCAAYCFSARSRKNGGYNTVTRALRDLRLINDKHIPGLFKLTSRQQRLELLSGLIDSDGHSAPKLGMKFVNTNRRLIDDVCWLARSLGLRACVTKFKTGIKKINYVGVAYAVVIAGKLSEIPVKVARKRMADTIKHSHSNTKLKIKSIGEGDYYGFEIDGNRRFLLGDFTVTHNTGFSINLALNMVSPAIGENVLYYACEISQELAMMRALCNLSRQPFEAAIDSPERFKQAVKNAMAERVAAHCLFKSFASKSSTIDDIRAHARSAISQLGFKPRVIVIDYAETIKPSDKRDQEYRQQSSIYTEARALGTELGCTVIMPDRCNRETVSKPVPNFTSFQGAFEKAGIVDVAIGLCVRSDQKVVTNLGLISIGHLNRFISAGKEVLALSHNFTTRNDEWKPIVNWFDNGESDQPFIRIKTDAASPYSVFQESKPMFVTPDHHVFRPDGTKVKAGDLRVGDKIRVLRFGEASVTSLELAPVSAQKRARWKVDIEVADNHNYYLASGTLVSNCATESEHMNNTLRTFVFLNRHGAPFQHLRGRVDPQTWRIELTEEIPYDPDAEDGDDSGSDKKRRRKSRDRGPVDEEI